MKHTLAFLLLILSTQAFALDSLSYSGRLVNPNGTPVTGTTSVKFDLVYTNDPTVVVCTKTIPVTLSNGVFHANFVFTPGVGGDCTGGKSLTEVMTSIPATHSVAYVITANGRTYSPQAVHSVPSAVMAKSLDRLSATDGQVLTWRSTGWTPEDLPASGGGSVSITAGTGLSGGTITGTGTIAIAAGGVTNTELAGNIARTKLASGTAGHVIVNDGSGVLSSVASLSIAHGGTGATTDSGARTNLGLGNAATAGVGYGTGNVIPGDSIHFVFQDKN